MQKVFIIFYKDYSNKFDNPMNNFLSMKINLHLNNWIVRYKRFVRTVVML
ncbi:hypothetical protein CFB3_39610 [Clostridium folliculivorans]|uniref:Uncharacterized protein n=1 Tax=Clostridium folliculivorans TaxID=2886038 RepID=A0A9W5Y3P2_9CLOT|nr:hypothetical protein CFOLD11_30080 [Clostridium folliculivorans]GKU31853.1 hypothetical protein CFB3_39610 [Clostridium folliculivorans]